ncbi:NADH-quinone oxidoreductase subunit N [Haliangium ochraceum]|uniref:NADH-quinone oxidoreductase subunit N n=1 Tax=Haliangium ochraceum (strain DSM 14365 / JCM 11303 / SMP-2) TaxID=502025 RepID=D0LZ07_HALO1|nr:NADH-quinone oxidoreductase subunit N [Haliangium ochraceum]ACY14477.1 proton-translocating NADH-quinone oxidoreductase, chain N [Haliangium ochraceum DSM 14365]
MSDQFSLVDLAYLTPFFILAVTAMLLCLAEAFMRTTAAQARLMGLAVAGCVLAAGAAIVLYRSIEPGSARPLFYGMLRADRFGYFFVALSSLLTAGTALSSPRHQEAHGWSEGAVYGVMLLATSGMAVMAMAGDMAAIFLGVETMSLAVYVLTALRRGSLRSSEAAMKYFLMGAFATGFLLYGMALIYGATGATNLAAIELALAEGSSPGLLVTGIFLLIIALGFKVAAVPFHMWAPDAYEGAPTPITGFMAAAVKASAFAVVLRLFGDVFATEDLAFGRMGWASPMVVLAALSMTIGNLAALRQENIKRMLAYSSVSHAGFLLVGVVATGLSAPEFAEEARTGVLYYLMAYGVTTIGGFAVASWIGSRGRERVLVDDWAGLASQHPGAALAMTIFMLSLGGIPPTAGFLGKFYVLKAAMNVTDHQLLWLVVLGAINAAVSIYYYLRVVMAMYFRDAIDEFKPLGGGAYMFVMAVCAIFVLEMGLLPGMWLSAAGVN